MPHLKPTSFDEVWDKLTVNDLDVQGTQTIKEDQTLNGDTTIGDAGTDLLTINAKLNSNFNINSKDLTSAILPSPTLKTDFTLDQTTADYTVSWNDPGAARTLTVPDPGGNDTFTFLDATQTLTNKTLTTPTIGDFTNAGHSHQNAAGGGTLDHGLALTGLSDDDHSQYALLAGRSGGQTLIGGTAASESLTLQSTSNATKGNIVVSDNINADGGITIADGTNIILDTTTGTQIGTGSTQKLAFYGTTPVAQQTALTAKDAGTVNSGDTATDSVISNNRTRIEEIETRLKAYGLLP